MRKNPRGGRQEGERKTGKLGGVGGGYSSLEGRDSGPITSVGGEPSRIISGHRGGDGRGGQTSEKKAYLLDWISQSVSEQYVGVQ